MIRNSAPWPGVDRTSTDAFDVAADDVEADATPRHVSDERGGGEAWLKRQPEPLLLVQRLRVDAPTRGLREHSVDVHTATVIGDGDDHFGAELHRVQADRPVRRLARRFAFCRQLDAVIHRVAHEVHE